MGENIALALGIRHNHPDWITVSGNPHILGSLAVRPQTF